MPAPIVCIRSCTADTPASVLFGPQGQVSTGMVVPIRGAQHRSRRSGNSPALGAYTDDRQERSAPCGVRNKNHYRPAPAVIREDRELLAELAQLNTDMAAFALRVMDNSASTAEQQHYAQRLIAAGQRLRRRAENSGCVVVEGVILADESTALPMRTVEPANHEPRR